jgi:hypothetical protein
LTADFNTNVQQLVGDWDLNGVRNAADLGVMLSGLADLNGYQTNHSLSAAQVALIGDVDHSGNIDNADLQAMLHLLITPSGGEIVDSSPPPIAASPIAADANRLPSTSTIIAAPGQSLESQQSLAVPEAAVPSPVMASNPIASIETTTDHRVLVPGLIPASAESIEPNLAATPMPRLTAIDWAISAWEKHSVRRAIHSPTDTQRIDGALEEPLQLPY